MFVLHLLRWLVTVRGWAVELLVAGPGDGDPTASGYALRSEAEALAPVHWLDAQGRPTNSERVRAGDYRLIYANTCTLGALVASLRAIAPPPTPVVCHAHELDHTLRTLVGPLGFDLLRRHIDHWIACSAGVRTALINGHGVAARHVDVVYECVPAAALATHHADRAALRQRLRVGPETFVIACCGTLDWRKGADLVVPLLQALRRRAPSIDLCLVWLGADPRRAEHARLVYECTQAGLTAHLRLVNPTSNIADGLTVSDVFALLSREDPFPLVMLEAAACGLPVVGFEGSGGVNELVTPQIGRLAPFLDVEVLAAQLLELAADRGLCKQLGDSARQRALDFDVNIILPRLANILERLLKASEALHP